MLLPKLFLLFLPLIGYSIQSTTPYCQICTIDQLIAFVDAYKNTYNLNWRYLLVDTGLTIYTQDYVQIQKLQEQIYSSYGIYTYFFLFDGYVDSYSTLEDFANGLMNGIDTYYNNNRAKTLVVFITLGSKQYYFVSGTTINNYVNENKLGNILSNAVKNYFPNYEYANGIYYFLNQFATAYDNSINGEGGGSYVFWIIFGVLFVLGIIAYGVLDFLGYCKSGDVSSSDIEKLDKLDSRDFNHENHHHYKGPPKPKPKPHHHIKPTVKKSEGHGGGSW